MNDEVFSRAASMIHKRNMLFLSLLFICGVQRLSATPRPYHIPNQGIADLLVNLLPQGYTVLKPPIENNKPVDVYITQRILYVGGLSESNSVFHLMMDLHDFWRDNRLNVSAYGLPDSGILVPKSLAKNLWKPMFTFNEARTINQPPDSTALLLYKNNYIERITRYQFTVTCNMDLTVFPMDTQRCAFTVRNLHEFDSTVHIQWIEHSPRAVDYQRENIDTADMMTDMEFSILKTLSKTSGAIDERQFKTVLYSIFTFKRMLTSSLVEIYLPSTLVVIISWAGFWLSVEAIPARTILAIQSVLTIVTQISKSASFKSFSALDIWLFVCQVLVCLTVLEFVIAFILSRIAQNQEGELPFGYNIMINDISLEDINEQDSQQMQKMEEQLKAASASKNRVLTVDVASRILFPAVFVMFTAIYWAVLIYYHHKKATEGFPVPNMPNITTFNERAR